MTLREATLTLILATSSVAAGCTTVGRCQANPEDPYCCGECQRDRSLPWCDDNDWNPGSCAEPTCDCTASLDGGSEDAGPGDAGDADAGPCGVCVGSTPICSETIGTCVGCLADDDCDDPTATLCDPSGACVACLADTDCPTDSRLCDSGACVTCRVDTDCPDAATPRCNAGSCSARTASAMSGGHWFTCALSDSGGVQCWGDNSFGQLGDGSTTRRSVGDNVIGLTTDVNGIATGEAHACAVTSSGGARCWGRNNASQLGDGTTINRPTPVAVTGLASGVAAIAAGFAHTCARTTAGGIQCWGANSNGQLGDGTATATTTPVAVVGLTGITEVVAGGAHSCARTMSGGVKCWGSNVDGQLGDGSTILAQSTPVDVTGLTGGVMALAAGRNHTCALTGVGGVRCWGRNSDGQLGDGTTTARATPVNVSGLTTGVIAIGAGEGHTCALTTAGAVRCWGRNNDGQLGDDTIALRTTHVGVTGLSTGATSITLGYIHSCAITSSGAYCWGDNSQGSLGNNSFVDSSIPVNVVGF